MVDLLNVQDPFFQAAFENITARRQTASAIAQSLHTFFTHMQDSSQEEPAEGTIVKVHPLAPNGVEFTYARYGGISDARMDERVAIMVQPTGQALIQTASTIAQKIPPVLVEIDHLSPPEALGKIILATMDVGGKSVTANIEKTIAAIGARNAGSAPLPHP